MKENEKIWLSIIALLVSIGILIYIIANTMDFSDLRLKSFGKEMMNDLKTSNYKQLYCNFYENYNQTFNGFVEHEKSLTKETGTISKYMFVAMKQRAGEIQLAYETKFSNFPNDKSVITWNVINDGRNWKLTGYDILVKSDLILSSNKSLPDSTTGSIDVKYKEFSNQIISDFKAGEYSSIYEKGDKQLHGAGSTQQFVNYLSAIEKDCGKLISYKLSDYEIGKDSKEIKFSYDLAFENSNSKLTLDLWVKSYNRLYLSGIKFVKSSW